MDPGQKFLIRVGSFFIARVESVTSTFGKFSLKNTKFFNVIPLDQKLPRVKDGLNSWLCSFQEAILHCCAPQFCVLNNDCNVN